MKERPILFSRTDGTPPAGRQEDADAADGQATTRPAA
jgi:hypothetical protein